MSHPMLEDGEKEQVRQLVVENTRLRKAAKPIADLAEQLRTAFHTYTECSAPDIEQRCEDVMERVNQLCGSALTNLEAALAASPAVSADSKPAITSAGGEAASLTSERPKFMIDTRKLEEAD